MHASIYIISATGEGSTFHAVLPGVGRCSLQTGTQEMFLAWRNQIDLINRSIGQSQSHTRADALTHGCGFVVGPTGLEHTPMQRRSSDFPSKATWSGIQYRRQPINGRLDRDKLMSKRGRQDSPRQLAQLLTEISSSVYSFCLRL